MDSPEFASEAPELLWAEVDLAEIPSQKKSDPAGEWYEKEFYPSYPRHEAKQPGLKAARAQLRTPELRAQALAGLQRQLPELRSRDPRMVPLPATWINGRRWEDESLAATQAQRKPVDSATERTKALIRKRIAAGKRPF